MFPRPVPVATRPCTDCKTPVQVRRLVIVPGRGEFGEDCATRLGLTVSKPRLRRTAQAGPTLFDNTDEEDCCDGWDR